jgi:hypothetical protein
MRGHLPFCSYRFATGIEVGEHETEISKADRLVIGAANRTRTCDPVITNDVLYQLSYCGEPSIPLRNVFPARDMTLAVGFA